MASHADSFCTQNNRSQNAVEWWPVASTTRSSPSSRSSSPCIFTPPLKINRITSGATRILFVTERCACFVFPSLCIIVTCSVSFVVWEENHLAALCLSLMTNMTRDLLIFFSISVEPSDNSLLLIYLFFNSFAPFYQLYQRCSSSYTWIESYQMIRIRMLNWECFHINLLLTTNNVHVFFHLTISYIEMLAEVSILYQPVRCSGTNSNTDIFRQSSNECLFPLIPLCVLAWDFCW